MTERKPPGVSFESWVDRQVREAAERGEFDDLPGAGKPLPDYGTPDSDDWWVRQYLVREVDDPDALLPPALRLRKEVERLPETVRGLRSESAVRDIVATLNRQIAESWRETVPGPRVHVRPVNVESVVERWRAERPGQ